MGGGHDLMDERSHHGATDVSCAEAENRRSLCSLMDASGFEPYEREWWHYVLRDEPHPDTYFDFPILYLSGEHANQRRQKRRWVTPLLVLGTTSSSNRSSRCS